MADRFRQFRFQVQERTNAVAQAQYEKDGVPEFAQTEWRNYFKKSYPWKTASAGFDRVVATLGAHVDVRLVDTRTGRVIDQHITEAV